jgi:glycosyltransferase involved in cell wall biosynthesis
MNRKITLALTNWNRCDLLIKSFVNVIDDNRIDEILILDDFSKIDIYKRLEKKINELNNPKIKLIRNEQNLGMSRNKNKAIQTSKNDWVIIFDSDNIINTDYIDTLYKIENWNRDVIYMPTYASKVFDYSEFSGITIDRHNVKKYIDKNLFTAALNTCNYFVNKAIYKIIYQYDKTIKGTDTIYFNYNWLLHENQLYFVPDLKYFHLSHNDSGFLDDGEYNMKQARKITNQIKKLK